MSLACWLVVAGGENLEVSHKGIVERATAHLDVAFLC